jgi:hypothetical protein
MLRALLVLAVACGSPAKPIARPAAVAPPDQCAQVADHLLSLMTAAAKDAPTEELDRVRVAFQRRCDEDRWSPEAQRCFLELTDKAEVDRCASRLTEEQRRSLEQPPDPAKGMVPGT